MKIIKMASLAAIVCISAATATAQNSGVELLKKMEENFKGLKSVAGSFTQTRVDPAFKTSVSVPASFQLLKPNFYRAQYQEGPGEAPSVQLIADQMFYNYVPKLKTVNTYKFKNQSNVRDLNYLLLGFGANTDEVTKVYKVQPLKSGTGVMLTPHSPQGASFNYITMQVDPKTYYPTQFTMQQPDKTELRVVIDASTLQINPALSPANFKPNFPGAKMVPMD